MKRKITDKLCEWKKQTKGRMPLLIYGARQVGKTFEMREFGAHYYKNTVYINFETDEKIGSYTCRFCSGSFGKILSSKNCAGRNSYHF